jgi:hypothetical protein
LNFRSAVAPEDSSRKLLTAFIFVLVFVAGAYEFAQLPWFPVAFTIFLYAVVLLLPMTFTSMQACEDFVINAYFWTLLGILFRLPTLLLSSQFANVSAPAGNPRLRPR